MRKPCYIARSRGNPRTGDGRDTTQIGYSGQAISKQFVKKNDESDFGSRLREAFGGASNTEIARKLDVQVSAVGNYISGRVPPAPTLLLIAKLTNCSLHWLLTGQGEADLDPYAFIDSGNRRIAEKIADSSKSSLSDVFNALMREGIRRRIADMVVNEEALLGAEIDQLRFMVDGLLSGDVDQEKSTSSAERRRQRRA